MNNYAIKKRLKRGRYILLACLISWLVMLTVPAIAQSPSTTQPPTSHQLGQQAYEQGQLIQAVNYWQGAMQDFVAEEDVRSQALTAGHLAIAYQDLGEWAAATETLETAQQLAQTLNDDFVTAQLLMAKGTQFLHQGEGTQALTAWQQAETRYQAIDDKPGILQSQLNQAQARQLLGKHVQAAQQLQQLADTIQSLPPSAVKVTGLQNLGLALHTLGDWTQAEKRLTESLSLAQQLSLLAAQSDSHLALGNLFRAQDDVPQAIQHYQQVTALAVNPASQLTAQLNSLKLLVTQGKLNDAIALLPSIQTQLNQLPPSRNTVYARVNLAHSLTALAGAINEPTEALTLSPDLAFSGRVIAQGLATAIDQARSLNDTKAEAYALGELGHVYELNQQWSEALELTSSAVQLAQESQAKEIAMPWQWQQGRILKAQGDKAGAIAAYSQAVTTLQALRQDLVALSPDIQFSFREQVEPVYRQMVELLLADVDTLPQGKQQEQLGRSRQLIEDLQLATLDNFFRQACLSGTPRTIDQIDQTAAVIYPILLAQPNGGQRLEVVVSLPGANGEVSELVHYGRAIAPGESQQLFNTLQATLTPIYSAEEIIPTAQTLYQWLIQPAEAQLSQHAIKTLVFVADGFLRNVPMAVLHDGNQFLIERYTIAISPGLQLLPSSSTQLNIDNQPQTLASGLSEQRLGFNALPNVTTELEQVQQLTPTETLLNRSFNAANIAAQLKHKSFPIFHLATHGQFSSNLEDTFLLTWDERLTIHELETLLSPQAYRQPIELLILSACQTARGDKQAALGLAGVAIRAGARSTLSTLWSVADASTAQLITRFYRNLTQDTTKAEALRQAQLSLLHSENYQHPYFWAPFVLVGNWQ